MIHDQEPTRLSHEDSGASDLLRTLIVRARASGPSPEQVARIRGGLGSSDHPDRRGGWSSKLGLVGLAAGLLGAFALATALTLTSSGTPSRAPAGRRSAQDEGVAVVRPAERSSTPAVAAKAVPASPSARAAPAPSESERRDVRRGIAAAGPARKTAPLESAPQALDAARPAPPAAQEGPSEIELLARAQRAMRRDPGQALALGYEHQERFPRGALTQEREVIIIDALVRFGRAADARARADRFRAQYPASAHWPRIERLLSATAK